MYQLASVQGEIVIKVQGNHSTLFPLCQRGRNKNNIAIKAKGGYCGKHDNILLALMAIEEHCRPVEKKAHMLKMKEPIF